MFDRVSQIPAVQSLARRLEQGGALSCRGVSESAQPYFAAVLRRLFPGRTLVVVTAGLYASQQVAFNDRVFLTGTVRADKNSAFGTDIGWIAYPAFSASWVISEEDFFPTTTPLSSLRLRSAVGRSGLRPSFRDAITYFEPTPVRASGEELPGITLAGAGNPDLKPEISTEVEIGFDAGFMQDRFSLEFTHYDKASKDALIRRRLAPSIGAVTTRFENIGSVSNKGRIGGPEGAAPAGVTRPRSRSVAIRPRPPNVRRCDSIATLRGERLSGAGVGAE